jgi:hypothetical protein
VGIPVAAEFEQLERSEIMASEVFNRPDFAFVQMQILVVARVLGEDHMRRDSGGDAYADDLGKTLWVCPGPKRIAGEHLSGFPVGEPLVDRAASGADGAGLRCRSGTE